MADLKRKDHTVGITIWIITLIIAYGIGYMVGGG